MRIESVEIQNFRKLKSCHIDISEKETLLVGANNSGKTSAIDALRLFLCEKNNIFTTDFTLSNWDEIIKIGNSWVEAKKDETPDLSIKKWEPYLPSLDLWLNITENEVHYVSHLIPTLDWDSGLLGVRLRLEPENIEKLYQDFIETFNNSQETINKAKEKKETINLQLWPKNLHDFLNKKLRNYFKIVSYSLDPLKYNKIDIQPISPNSIPLEGDPLHGLIKIDIINAQRGFSDPNTSTINNSPKDIGNLSTQFKNYYTTHLNPTDAPNTSDIEALEAIDNAQTTFDEKLKTSFNSAITELEELGYPGFGNPKITLSSKVNPIDGLNHSAAVQFDVMNNSQGSLRLPEKYNGLGYQNLISMIFQLIRFRNEWLRKGKNNKKNFSHIEPLHLILIEEPEAHLHAQIQQVFINKAYNILRNDKELQDKTQFSTQLIVSTHSSHIAHEVDFIKLRYFQRKQAHDKIGIPTASVVNLSKVFGDEDITTKFSIRYLKTTHCDLFFADAVILVEGSAERMLIPHFIRNNFKELTTSYISILEIGGSHADKLKPLIESLGLICLIITDTDSICPTTQKATLPQRNQNLKTNNSVLKTWIPKIDSFDTLLDLGENKKILNNFPIRATYQFPIKIILKGNEEEVIPYTFEDALVFENIELFKKLKETGLVNKFNKILKKELNKSEMCKEIFDAIRNGDKAKFALDLLYIADPKELVIPSYIKEGLKWLDGELITKQNNLINDIEDK
ncbi:ATP-dependent endonuclease [Malaciobacter sp. WC5094]